MRARPRTVGTLPLRRVRISAPGTPLRRSREGLRQVSRQGEEVGGHDGGTDEASEPRVRRGKRSTPKVSRARVTRRVSTRTQSHSSEESVGG